MKIFDENSLDALIFIGQVLILWKAPAVISHKIKKLSRDRINQMSRHELNSDIFIILFTGATFAFMCKIVFFDRIAYTVKTLLSLLK